MGIAPRTRMRAWRRPSTPPITNAEDTDGTCFRSLPSLTGNVDLSEQENELQASPSGSDKAMTK